MHGPYGYSMCICVNQHALCVTIQFVPQHVYVLVTFSPLEFP